MSVDLPTNLLRSFVAIVDAGSMIRAADEVHVTQAALSLRIKRLEEIVRQPLFDREGQRLTLTGTGDLLLDHARQALALNDQAVARLAAETPPALVRIGTVQGFTNRLLREVLTRFSELNPEAQIQVKVSTPPILRTMIEKGQLDVLLSFGPAGSPEAVRTMPVGWFGSKAVAALDPVPLVVLERPCRARDAAIASLDAAGRRYRIALEVSNVTALRLGVEAELGVSCRPGYFPGEEDRDCNDLLPALPDVGCIVERARGLKRAPAQFADLAIRTLLQFH